MQIIAQYLILKMQKGKFKFFRKNLKCNIFNLIKNKENKDTSNISHSIQTINIKWHETQDYLKELTKNTEKNFLIPKIYDELATLRDVHEGYQRYINSTDQLSQDPQRLNLQLETNKVQY
jgi:hypothetical protein